MNGSGSALRRTRRQCVLGSMLHHAITPSVCLVEINKSYDGRRLPWVESVLSSANGTSSTHVRKQISVGLPG